MKFPVGIATGVAVGNFSINSSRDSSYNFYWKPFRNSWWYSSRNSYCGSSRNLLVLLQEFHWELFRGFCKNPSRYVHIFFQVSFLCFFFWIIAESPEGIPTGTLLGMCPEIYDGIFPFFKLFHGFTQEFNKRDFSRDSQEPFSNSCLDFSRIFTGDSSSDFYGDSSRDFLKNIWMPTVNISQYSCVDFCIALLLWNSRGILPGFPRDFPTIIPFGIASRMFLFFGISAQIYSRISCWELSWNSQAIFTSPPYVLPELYSGISWWISHDFFFLKSKRGFLQRFQQELTQMIALGFFPGISLGIPLGMLKVEIGISS